MTPAIHYLLTTIWGLATPILMGWGAQSIIGSFAADSEHLGHPSPVEFIFLFLLIGALCLAVFLLYDLACALLFLPKDGKRRRCFFLALLLYILVSIGGWIVAALLETAMGKLFA